MASAAMDVTDTKEQQDRQFVMSTFAGVSVVTDGKLCSTTAIDTAVTDNGYHLLLVKDYSRTVREIPNGEVISSEPFMVGGHRWDIWYYPNGYDASCSDYISLLVRLADDDIEDHDVPVNAHFEFSFVDDVEKQKPKYIRATETCGFSVERRLWGSMKFMRRDILKRLGHLKGDCFTVRCDIMVCKDDDNTALSCDVHENFDNLLKSKLFSDVTFEVNGEMFAAHRCVLAARSKVFMAQLFGPMTEATTSSAIQVKDMESKVFAALLSFIYTDSFPKMDKENNTEEEKGQDEEEEVEDVMRLQDLFVAADRYDLPRLKLLCENQLSEHIGLRSVASTLALAEQHHCHELKEVCFKFIQLQSPKCLDKIMATDGWERMIATYPSILNELVAKLVSNQKKGKKRKHNRT